MSSWKDIRTSSQRLQSLQRRTESPKTGREEKTRKMAREAKIITRPSLPAPVPSKPNLSHLLITRAVVPVPLPHAMPLPLRLLTRFMPSPLALLLYHLLLSDQLPLLPLIFAPLKLQLILRPFGPNLHVHPALFRLRLTGAAHHEWKTLAQLVPLQDLPSLHLGLPPLMLESRKTPHTLSPIAPLHQLTDPRVMGKANHLKKERAEAKERRVPKTQEEAKERTRANPKGTYEHSPPVHLRHLPLLPLPGSRVSHFGPSCSPAPPAPLEFVSFVPHCLSSHPSPFLSRSILELGVGHLGPSPCFSAPDISLLAIEAL